MRWLFNRNYGSSSLLQEVKFEAWWAGTIAVTAVAVTAAAPSEITVFLEPFSSWVDL